MTSSHAVAVQSARAQPVADRFVTRLLGSAPRPRAFADDEADLLDGWVCADLWRRLGIPYDLPGWAHAVGFDAVESPPFPRG